MFLRQSLSLLLAGAVAQAQVSTVVMPANDPCAYDLTEDNLVSTNDLLYLLATFGRDAASDPAAQAADVDGSGSVGTSDLLGLLAVFGRTCQQQPVSGPAPPPPVSLQDAAAEFAAAMSVVDPYTTLVAISSSIHFSGDLSAIAIGQARLDFEQAFATTMAASLGDGSTVSPGSVIVDEIREAEADWQMGRRRVQVGFVTNIEVLFHLLVPATLQTTGASLVNMMQQTNQTIQIDVAQLSFSADAASMTPPTAWPAVVDCDGSWVVSANCSEPCGPSGVLAQNFEVTRAEQNGGADCLGSQQVPLAQSCNMHIQCPVDCAGNWGQWGVCSLPCGNGTRSRAYAVFQEPQHGGGQCPERDTTQSQECNTQSCPPPPPAQVDCLGSWSGYGQCSHLCGPAGVQQRTFSISLVASGGGSACAAGAGDEQSQPCNTWVNCPVDCAGNWGDFGACSEPCGGGARVRDFSVTSQAQFGGICPEEGTTQSEACHTFHCPTGLVSTAIAAGRLTLPVSGRNELASLVQVTASIGGQPYERGSATPVGRSYNGYEWEGVMPSPVTFQCTNATSPVTCTTILPNASYQLRLYNGTELGTEQLASNPATVASRFLTQTTFGPTLGEIGNLSASTIEETETRMADWLLRQMEMEPSLHRAYVRRRWNPKSDNAPHVMMRPPCKEGSSWVDVAFSDMDRGKTVDVSLTPDGSYSLSIDGIVRTVIQNPKDVREDLKYSCYKRGYRTPLDMGGQGSTDEVSLEACHVRCVATTGCGYFSFLPSLSANPSPPSDGSSPGECHLQAADSHYLRGLGGQWRSGPADCADSVYEYPPADSGLLHMGHSCWPQCRAHGSCPDRCGANGYCCKFGRDINGCVTTDTSATTHRCIPNPSMAAPPNSPAPRLQANESYVVCWVPEYEGGEVALLLPGVPFIRTNPAWKMKECAAALDEMIVIGNPIVNLTDPDAFITQQFDGIVMDPITAGAARNSFALRNDAFSDANCRLPNNPTVFIRHAGRFFRHDPRLQLMDNTIDAPHIETRIDSQRDRTFVPSLTPTFCTAVKQSFTNSRGCVRQNSCSQPVWSGGTLTLDEQLLRQLFTRSQKYVYYVTGLRLDGEQGYLGRGFSDSEISPCSATTRWQTTVGACDADTPLDDDTLASLSAALTTGGIHHNHTRIGVPVNVAIGKLATAFSVAWPRQFPAGLGNDGNTAGDWGQGSCTHTTAGANSWWQVDLGATFNVDSINVYHRTDSNQHEFRVNGGIVRISDTTDYSTGMQCGGALAEGGFSGVDMLDCGGQSGQFVTVTNDFITVCEVEVMSRETTLIVLQTPNITDIAAVQGVHSGCASGMCTCTAQLNGVSAVGAKLTVGGTCFEQVHPDSHNVYDFAYWLGAHPGNKPTLEAGGHHPIKRLAAIGGVEFRFPSAHDMTRWPSGGPHKYGGTRRSSPYLRYVGVLGQHIDFSALPTTTQVPWLAELSGVADISVNHGTEISCGSAGEERNDPSRGHKYGGRYVSAQKPTYNDLNMYWPNAVFQADDQLRQRVAWALSQIYVISTIAIGINGLSGRAETYASYYDIMVTNAFGNFGQMIREVAYSRPMAQMLTFLNSQSAAVSGNFADENFARECIQLFTVGVEHLNLDGTPVLDDFGNRIPTYDVKDVASFARSWTGFQTEESLRYNAMDVKRGGAAAWYSGEAAKSVDKLKINAEWRDASPKGKLSSGYIGDGYPACVDLPKRTFLTQGFAYIYRGSISQDVIDVAGGGRLSLTLQDPTSALFQVLCGGDGSTGCTFPSGGGEIKLTQSLPCFGDECEIDRVVFVQLIDQFGVNAFYEAVPIACANFPFFNDGRMTRDHQSRGVLEMTCADPLTAAAAPLCCSDSTSLTGTATADCQYVQELTTYDTAAMRCGDQVICNGYSGIPIRYRSCHPNSWQFTTWSSRSCETQVQVQRDGRVSAVHVGELGTEPIAPINSIGGKSIFDVGWVGGSYPAAVSNCSADAASVTGSVCTVDGSSCVCSVEVSVSAVFNDTSQLPTASDVRQSLNVGAINPEAFPAGEYVRCDSLACTTADVEVWTKRQRAFEVLRADIHDHNVALHKPSTTSSQLRSSMGVHLINDGDTAQAFYHSQCSNDIPGSPVEWVQVNLENLTTVKNVKIHHRPGYPYRVNGATIIISETPDFTTGVQCGRTLTATSDGETVAHCVPSNVGSGLSGQYVTVRQQGQCLQMRELEVFADRIVTPDGGYMYAPELYEFASLGELTLDVHTIFKLQNGDRTAELYANRESRVIMQDFSFRNPPTLIDIRRPTLRQAQMETDEVLHHLTTHLSTAPFICKKLIQKLTTSNPSPRYVKEVVMAFRSGQYGGNVYSGEYGDLGAAVAAIFMDREARDVTLDLDPAAGKLREPVLKVLHVMRSLEYKPRDGVEIEMLWSRIGQIPFYSPSIFNYYLPDYTPTGPVARASLYAPEAELLTTPYVIGYMNGIASLADNGLTGCDGGFGVNMGFIAQPHLLMQQSCANAESKRMTAEGAMKYEYQGQTADIVSEMSLVLTSGREPPFVRAYYDTAKAVSLLPPGNVAIGKLATASTVGSGGVASRGNDGNTAGDWGQGSCTHTTDGGGGGWWQVDLGATFNVDSINVYHRTDSCCSNRVNGGIVRISDTTDYSTGMQCGGALAEGGVSGVDMLDCGGQSGQFVTVTNDFITVCEVEVMAPLTTPSDADLLPALTKLFAFSPEFSATNVNSLQENARPAIPEIPTQNRAYKAIVVMFLEGGVDSFNILVPHSNCTVAGEVTDLYTEYARIRSSVALGLQELLPLDNLDTLDNAQPCSTFGTHPNLGLVKNLWDAGQASWFANIGCLIKPTTRADFMAGDRPPFLFGHDSQQREIQSVHAQNSGANGVLGRILNAVTSQAEPYRSKVYSMYGIRKLVEGDVPPTILARRTAGVQRFSQYAEFATPLAEMTGYESESIFADTYAGTLERSLASSERLGALLGGVDLVGSYPGGTGLENVARIMALPHAIHQSERDVFMVGIRTFDTHSSNSLDKLSTLNGDLTGFKTDLEALNLWDNTTIVTISDFGRSISSNGRGTDHAWGGNMFMIGGDVKGRRIHGQFPEDLDPVTSPIEVGRGRGIFIPSMPWEGMWYGLAQWFGVADDKLLEVLPNAANFQIGSAAMPTKQQMFN